MEGKSGRRKAVERVFDFAWLVHKAGYRWIKTRPASGSEPSALFLVEQEPEGAPARPRIIRPLDVKAGATSGLFHDLAALSDSGPSQEQVLAFANLYGVLGADQVPVRVPIPDKPGVFNIVPGETLEAWQDQVRTMAAMVRVWEWARTKQVTSLARFIKWQGKESVFYEDNYKRTAIANEGIRPWLLKSDEPMEPGRLIFRPGDVLMPAWYLLRQVINERLKEAASLQLTWNDDGKPTLAVKPASLAAALWFQLAQGIEGDRQYRKCAVCGTHFAVSGGKKVGLRADADTCGGACRQRRWRDRQKSRKKRKSI